MIRSFFRLLILYTMIMVAFVCAIVLSSIILSVLWAGLDGLLKAIARKPIHRQRDLPRSSGYVERVS